MPDPRDDLKRLSEKTQRRRNVLYERFVYGRWAGERVDLADWSRLRAGIAARSGEGMRLPAIQTKPSATHWLARPKRQGGET